MLQDSLYFGRRGGQLLIVLAEKLCKGVKNSPRMRARNDDSFEKDPDRLLSDNIESLVENAEKHRREIYRASRQSASAFEKDSS